MPAVSYPRKLKLSLLAVAAVLFGAVLCSVTANPPTARAQSQQSLTQAQEQSFNQEHEQPSTMIGSSPLYDLTSDAGGWINTKPLTSKQLKGKVVLVDFWTYSCINCLRSVPYINAWAEKYKDSGLVVIGVHTPEFGFEKQQPNVQTAVQKFGITYPVALDSDWKIWNFFHNQSWPAEYFIDARGRVRYQHFSEGDYTQSEQWIQQLLRERNAKLDKSDAANALPVPGGIVNVQAQGVEAAADSKDVRSPETYIGYARAQRFASHGGLKSDSAHLYTPPQALHVNDWGLYGQWVDHEQTAMLKSAGGGIIFRFDARDLHLVLGPAADGKPIHFRVAIDGHAPGDNHGVDTDAQGNGVVTNYRLYQLIRQQGSITDHVFTIEFQDPGVQAFAFTFG